MSAKLLVLIVVCVSLLTACGDSDAPEPYTGFPADFTAVWLNSDYVQELEASRSPMRALGAVSDDRVAITLHQDGANLIRTTLSRFNDRMVDTFDFDSFKGEWRGLVNNDASTDATTDAAAENTGAQALAAKFDDASKVRSTDVALGDMTLSIATDGTKKIMSVQFAPEQASVEFTAIPGGTAARDFTIDTYLSGIILEGVYEDEAGSQTIFAADGEVAWDGQGRYYTLLFGDRITDCDVIILSDDESGAAPHEIYGFERSESGLDLYATTLDENNTIRCSNAMLKSLTLK